jgi:hypothetical protein
LCCFSSRILGNGLPFGDQALFDDRRMRLAAAPDIAKSAERQIRYFPQLGRICRCDFAITLFVPR